VHARASFLMNLLVDAAAAAAAGGNGLKSGTRFAS
jgi:hypothetical protein